MRKGALVDLAVKDFGWVMAAAQMSAQSRVIVYNGSRILGSPIVVDEVENALHLVQLGFGHGLTLGCALGRGNGRVVLAHCGFGRHSAQSRKRSLLL